VNAKKIKAVSRYGLRVNFKIFRIVYLVIYFNVLFDVISWHFSAHGNSSSDFADMELVSLISIFVTGLCSFKAPFRFFLSEGMSRRSFFTGTAVSFGITSAALSALDCVNAMAFPLFMPYHSLYASLAADAVHSSRLALIKK
jgi:hypothetical protein